MKMKRYLFLVLLLGLSTAISFAQSGRASVAGTVLDETDNSPVVQATVQLLSLPDSTMVVGDVTNLDGRFKLTTRPGKYVLKVSFVGYLSYIKQIQLTSAKPLVNLGNIILLCLWKIESVPLLYL